MGKCVIDQDESIYLDRVHRRLNIATDSALEGKALQRTVNRLLGKRSASANAEDFRYKWTSQVQREMADRMLRVASYEPVQTRIRPLTRSAEALQRQDGGKMCLNGKSTLMNICQIFERSMETTEGVGASIEIDIRKIYSKSIDDITVVLSSYFTKGPSEQSKFKIRSQISADHDNRLDLLAKKQVKRCIHAVQTFLRFITQFDVLCKLVVKKVNLPSMSSSKML